MIRQELWYLNWRRAAVIKEREKAPSSFGRVKLPTRLSFSREEDGGFMLVRLTAGGHRSSTSRDCPIISTVMGTAAALR